MANHYALSGHGIEISYTIGGGPSFTALTLTDGGMTRSYTPGEITTDETGVGTLVSVPVKVSTDAGGTRFGFFLPAIQLTLGERAPVTTIGATEIFGGPNSVPHKPATWRCVHLHGTAQQVIVALERESAG